MEKINDKEYFTIKELADKYKVSKQSVYKQVIKNDYNTLTIKKKIQGRPTMLISEGAIKKLNKHFNNDNNNVNGSINNRVNDSNTNNKGAEDNNNVNDELLKSKQQTIDMLQRELDKVHAELDKVHTELQHEQELHLQDQAAVKKLQTKLNEVKEIGQKETNNSITPDNDNQSITNQQPNDNQGANKHWWQFWK